MVSWFWSHDPFQQQPEWSLFMVMLHLPEATLETPPVSWSWSHDPPTTTRVAQFMVMMHLPEATPESLQWSPGLGHGILQQQLEWFSSR